MMGFTGKRADILRKCICVQVFCPSLNRTPMFVCPSLDGMPHFYVSKFYLAVMCPGVLSIIITRSRVFMCVMYCTCWTLLHVMLLYVNKTTTTITIKCFVRR